MSGDDDSNREKNVKGILEDYEERELSEKENQEKRSQKEKSRKSLYQFIFGFLGCFIVLVLFVRLVNVVSDEKGPLSKKSYWRVGNQKDTDYKVSEGVQRLWRVRKAINAFYTDHKELPQEVHVLYKGGYLQKEVSCSITGEGYVLKSIGGEKSFCCPNPTEHGVSELCCYVKSGPPFVIQWDED